MPGSYPPAPPTMTNNLLSVHRLLKSPTLVQRQLRTLADLRFVADRILTQRFRTSGGAVQYEISEPLTNTREVEAIAPGAEYPRDTPGIGTAAVAAVSKWGEAVFLADEQIKRSVYGGQAVDRALRKTVNTIISKVDGLATAAVASAVTATRSAIAGWESDAGARMYRDIELGAATILDLNDGYNPNTVLMSTEKYALLITDQNIATLRRRESDSNPIYGGMIESIGKYQIIHTASSNLPSDDVWVFDRDQLGGMADEPDADPGFAMSDQGVQVKVVRVEERDGWDLMARRITVPIVTEPNAGVKITDTDGS